LIFVIGGGSVETELKMTSDAVVAGDPEVVPIDPTVANGKFCAELAPRSLRVTCYGSSSSRTPERYLREARSLGYILARRGHVCVNGAGSFGCMAAMNDGCLAGNGHVVGVIHEMFLVDNGYWGNSETVTKTVIRDGGAHRVFENATMGSNEEHEESHSGAAVAADEHGPIREILVAGGDDLQERKKLLVRNADALVVLPGGPGTWDEVSQVGLQLHA
jgi:predicted Rossmann-fold nucleotide-binding protein